ncbi:MAG TPA: GTP-binding protein [Candidatus Lokiarchaeia archaeon]|nr:GTP-binding protein [Candidatus Lokiarchaeia archaeon]
MSENAEPSKWKYKICLFGAGAVGKTSLIIRFIRSSFNDSLKKTIGTNFLIKDVEIDNNAVRLLIWDIGGQAAFSTMRRVYFKGSNGAIGVYDVTSQESLLKIPGWVSSIKKAVGNIPMILIGNKIDLERKVTYEEGKELADRLGCEYIETSAKTGEGVEEGFLAIARNCLDVGMSKME